MAGRIIDASIVPVPQRRNSRDENARIEDGETPEGWEGQLAKRRQKDGNARGTKKHGKSHDGYKNHVNLDRRYKRVRRDRVTGAAAHDGQLVEGVLDSDDTASDVWAEGAYRSAEIGGLKSLAYDMRRLAQLERLAAVAPQREGHRGGLCLALTMPGK